MFSDSSVTKRACLLTVFATVKIGILVLNSTVRRSDLIDIHVVLQTNLGSTTPIIVVPRVISDKGSLTRTTQRAD